MIATAHSDWLYKKISIVYFTYSRYKTSQKNEFLFSHIELRKEPELDWKYSKKEERERLSREGEKTKFADFKKTHDRIAGRKRKARCSIDYKFSQ